jgi:hypothetical protein
VTDTELLDALERILWTDKVGNGVAIFPANLREAIEAAVRDVDAPPTTCWLCGMNDAETTITVACETPGGRPCKEKDVLVHHGCYMDVDP